MVLMTFCLLVAFSLDSAAKCDDYVVGTVWIHKGNGDDEREYYEGCKKGCFWNNSYTEMGVRKCEKCEDITDEITCTNNDATCRWKGGKCKPQSCPQIANTRNTGAFVLNNTNAAASKGRERLLKECVEGSELEKKYNNQYWDDYFANKNLQYKVENKRDTCTKPGCGNEGFTSNGDANKAICDGYSGCHYESAPTIGGTVNHENDQCVRAFSDERCEIIPVVNTNTNNDTCRTKTGCSFVQGVTPGFRDTCVVGCTLFKPGQGTKSDCEALPGNCTYIGLDIGDGKYLRNSDRCEVGCHDRFTPGTSTKAQCNALNCDYEGDDQRDRASPYYISETYSAPGLCYDSSGNVRSEHKNSESCLRDNTQWYDSYSRCQTIDGYNLNSCTDESSCNSSSGCLSYWTNGVCTGATGNPLTCTDQDSCYSTTAGSGCSGSNWTPGYCAYNMGNRLSCYSEMSCLTSCSSRWIWDGECVNISGQYSVDIPHSFCGQNNRRWVEGSVYPGDGVNLKTGGVATNCTFWETDPAKCGINTTLDLILNPDIWETERCDDRLYGSYPGNPPPRYCRLLFHIRRQVCEFDINTRMNAEVFNTSSKFGGNLRPGTWYEKCVQDETLRPDEFNTVTLAVKGEQEKRYANLTGDHREILLGFQTPGNYCQHLVDLKLAECQKEEEESIESCYTVGEQSEDLALDYGLLFRDHVQTKAASAACREIYGCMYAKDNERCSAWAVWALVLTIVLVVVVVVAALAVVGVFVLLKVLKSKA